MQLTEQNLQGIGCVKLSHELYSISPIILRVTLEIVVRLFDTFDNNFEIKNYFTKYLKESL